MNVTSSQILIPDTSPDKQQPVSNVKYYTLKTTKQGNSQIRNKASRSE